MVDFLNNSYPQEGLSICNPPHLQSSQFLACIASGEYAFAIFLIKHLIIEKKNTMESIGIFVFCFCVYVLKLIFLLNMFFWE